MALTPEQYMRISAYLSGNASKQERKELEAWRKAALANEHQFLEAERIWNHSGKKLTWPDADVNSHWDELRRRIDLEAGTKQVFLWPHRNIIWKAAAGLVLLATLTYVLFWKRSSEVNLHSGNAVAMVYLPDSTQVWLNLNSSLSYDPKAFGKTNRHTKLSGEGYFNVRPAQNNPFTVNTRNTAIRVLGTSFNVKEEGNERVNVTVAEGTVQFSPADSSKQKSIQVNANEVAIWKADEPLEKSKNTESQYAAWRKKNNPVYEKEVQHPATYITPKFNWRKNAINQSVIYGTLTSSALLADYRNIHLRVTYTKNNGTASSAMFTISPVLKAGSTLDFERRLLDFFADTKSLDVEVVSAEVVQ